VLTWTQPGRCECSPTVADPEGNVHRVGTCPVCLPAGAISLMIADRYPQLELFEEGGVLSHMRGDVANEHQGKSIALGGLPELPF